jgi:hypothetical protein
MLQLNFFGHLTFLDLDRLIDSGLISTIDLATKFGCYLVIKKQTLQ